MGQHREFFRLDLHLKIFLKKILYNKEENKYYIDKTWQVLNTENISAKGMLINNDNLEGDFKKGDYLLIKFTIPGKLSESIYLIAEIVRVLEKNFAVNYTLIGEINRDKLVNSFLKISHEKIAKKFD